MKRQGTTLRYERTGGDTEPRSVVVSFFVSLSAHLLLIGAMIYVPMNFSAPRLPPGAISVDLVSLPGPSPGPSAGDGAPPSPKPKPEEPPPPQEKPAISVPEPLPAPKPVVEAPKPEVSLAPKIKEKKSLKEVTKDPQKMIERAIDRIEKKVNEPDTRSVTAAIERLKKKFGETEPAPGPPGPSRGQGGGGLSDSGGGGPGQIEPVDIYRVTVASQVERNWAFSPQLAGASKTLRVGLVFKVLPNGEITDIRYTERSNNSYLDESAYRAIVKSNPVTPHPPMIKAPYVLIAIRFTPEGIR